MWGGSSCINQLARLPPSSPPPLPVALCRRQHVHQLSHRILAGCKQGEATQQAPSPSRSSCVPHSQSPLLSLPHTASQPFSWIRAAGLRSIAAALSLGLEDGQALTAVLEATYSQGDTDRQTEPWAPDSSCSTCCTTRRSLLDRPCSGACMLRPVPIPGEAIRCELHAVWALCCTCRLTALLLMPCAVLEVILSALDRDLIPANPAAVSLAQACQRQQQQSSSSSSSIQPAELLPAVGRYPAGYAPAAASSEELKEAFKVLQVGVNGSQGGFRGIQHTFQLQGEEGWQPPECVQHVCDCLSVNMLCCRPSACCTPRHGAC